MAFNLFGTGHPLPHPTIEPLMLRRIERAIVKAWELVRTAPPHNFDLTVASEDQITAVLYNTLVTRVLSSGVVRGFTPDLFRVAREPKVWSYDEGSLDKMPDLFFYLISDRTVAFPDQDGLFVECKPIDIGHAAGGHYCDRGLGRFINGEYAWAMQEGMMIGYAVTGYQLPKSLSTPLAERDRPTRMPLLAGPTAVPRTADTRFAQRPHFTSHSRPFTYRNGGAAPPIDMFHLWLRRD